MAFRHLQILFGDQCVDAVALQALWDVREE